MPIFNTVVAIAAGVLKVKNTFCVIERSRAVIHVNILRMGKFVVESPTLTQLTII